MWYWFWLRHVACKNLLISTELSAIWTNITLGTQKQRAEESRRALILVLPQRESIPGCFNSIDASASTGSALVPTRTFSRGSRILSVLLNILKRTAELTPELQQRPERWYLFFIPFFHGFSRLSKDRFNTATPTLYPEHTSECQLYAHKSSGSSEEEGLHFGATVSDSSKAFCLTGRITIQVFVGGVTETTMTLWWYSFMVKVRRTYCTGGLGPWRLWWPASRAALRLPLQTQSEERGDS